MPRYVTSPCYEVDIGAHVFPTRKYRLVVDRLIAEDGARRENFLAPPPAAESDIVRVHTSEYYRRCRAGTLSPREILQLELPWSPEVFDSASRCVQGSIMAARLAIDHGVGIHIGGGFHHAFPDHGEGFCVFNDPACAVRAMQADGRIQRALVADCDLHHGNGTAAIFAADDTVATFSIHQQDIYPAVKPPSDVDVGLHAGCGDHDYLVALRRGLLPLLERHRPDLLLYVAGADPYEQDQLGTLQISKDGLRARDGIVVDACRLANLPLVVVLAGGYARRVADTVTIHLETIRTAIKLWR